MMPAALFPSLMGDSFASLDEGVRAVHGGQGRTWSGTASVERGRGVFVPLLARMAGLPPTQRRVRVQVEIHSSATGEEWARNFGDAPVMRSSLRARDGLLEERLGWVVLRFRLHAQQGGVHWQLVRLSLGPIPLPVRLFAVTAQSLPGPSGYRFVVAAHIAGIGELIRYDGDLEVAHE
jgi:hypothetical protein